jgi:hypothetical protein
MSKLTWIGARAFSDYTNWECHLAGFHHARFNEQDRDNAARILSDRKRLLNASRTVLLDWPITSAVHLSNLSLNRKAWMGHAANFIVCGAGEDSSVAAYWTLTQQQQDMANGTVMEVILEWEQDVLNRAISRPQKSQLEFQFLMPQD